MATKLNTTETFTMSYRRNETKYTYDGRSIQDFIRHWSEKKPDNEAFVFVSLDGSREVVTWRALYDNSIEYAHAFLYLGLKEKDIVGISMRANSQCLYLHFGAIFAGIIPTDIVFTRSDCHDVIALLNKLTECKTVILDPIQGNISWSVFRSLFTSGNGHARVSSEAIPSVKYLILTSSPKDDKKCFIFSDLLHQSRQSARGNLPSVDPMSIGSLFQTSGSTGVPKSVAHTQKAIILSGLHQVDSSGGRAYVNRIFNWGNCWPTNVISGQTWICQSSATDIQGDNPDFALKVIRQESCSVINLVPCQVEDLTAVLELETQTLAADTVTTTGQYATKNSAKCLGILAPNFINMYGSTEAREVLEKRVQTGETFEDGCCGDPLPGIEVKIVDENDTIVPVNTKGELLIRSPTMFTGYYNDEEKTQSVLTADGWFRSDDVATMKEDGNIFIEGRKSDMIICRGVNIWPVAIENVLLKYPGVKHAMVVPIPHQKFYQEICACIIAEEDSNITEDAIRQFCEDFFIDKLEDVIVLPAYYIFFHSFPKTRTQKISRKQLTVQATEAVRNMKSSTTERKVQD